MQKYQKTSPPLFHRPQSSFVLVLGLSCAPVHAGVQVSPSLSEAADFSLSLTGLKSCRFIPTLSGSGNLSGVCMCQVVTGKLVETSALLGARAIRVRSGLFGKRSHVWDL